MFQTEKMILLGYDARTKNSKQNSNSIQGLGIQGSKVFPIRQLRGLDPSAKQNITVFKEKNKRFYNDNDAETNSRDNPVSKFTFDDDSDDSDDSNSTENENLNESDSESETSYDSETDESNSQDDDTTYEQLRSFVPFLPQTKLTQRNSRLPLPPAHLNDSATEATAEDQKKTSAISSIHSSNNSNTAKEPAPHQLSQVVENSNIDTKIEHSPIDETNDLPFYEDFMPETETQERQQQDNPNEQFATNTPPEIDSNIKVDGESGQPSTSQSDPYNSNNPLFQAFVKHLLNSQQAGNFAHDTASNQTKKRKHSKTSSSLTKRSRQHRQRRDISSDESETYDRKNGAPKAIESDSDSESESFNTSDTSIESEEETSKTKKNRRNKKGNSASTPSTTRDHNVRLKKLPAAKKSRASTSEPTVEPSDSIAKGTENSSKTKTQRKKQTLTAKDRKDIEKLMKLTKALRSQSKIVQAKLAFQPKQ